MKKLLKPIVLRSLLVPVKAIELFYTWLWDGQAAKEPDAYLHQKIIWETRNIRRRIESSLNKSDP